MIVSYVLTGDGDDTTVPRVMTEGAAGLDLCAAIRQPIVLAPGERGLVPCGIALEVPLGYEAQVRPRSGLALKHGVTVLNGPGTIDSDYRGEVQCLLINHGSEPFMINRGDRIGQLIVKPVTFVKLEKAISLSDTKRGVDGWGSSGVSNHKAAE